MRSILELISINIERIYTFVLLQNRRERITERLKVLQELVPNGSKVGFTISWIRTFLQFGLRKSHVVPVRDTYLELSA